MVRRVASQQTKNEIDSQFTFMILEICIDSYASALAAKNGGADRLELCSALAVGGTTPSSSLVEQCVNELGMPSMMMIRPHDGGFVYSEHDLCTMIGSIEVAKSIGVQGVVFGVLTSDRKIDTETCRRLLEHCNGLETTFHRAIDVAEDPLTSLAAVESLGFDRVLTSGQQRTAIEGADLIRKMVHQSNSIKILAGSGVNADNVADLISQAGVREVHASASNLSSESQTQGDVTFGDGRRVTCETIVAQLKNSLSDF